jgi:pyruvate kinase
LNRRGILTKVMSKLHPKQPVYSMAYNFASYRQLNLYWGVFPIEVSNKNTNKRILSGVHILKAKKIVKKSDRLIFVFRDYLTNYLNLKIVEVK